MSALDTLQRFEVDPDRCRQYQVLCLPENIESAANRDELFDAGDTADLSKRLKAAGLRCANSYDLGIDVGVLDRRGADLWLGFVWIMDNLAIPVVVGVVSTVLASMIERKSKSTPPAIQQSVPKVHLALGLLRGDDLTTLKYKGDADTLIRVLNAIKPDEGSDE